MSNDVDKIYVEEWLKLLESSEVEKDANSNMEGVFTAKELKEIWKVGISKVRDRLRQLIKLGLLESTKKVIVTISGVKFPVPAYRIKFSSKQEKGKKE